MAEPRPELLAAMRAALAVEPTITKSALARKLGISRQTCLYALRHLKPAATAPAVVRATTTPISHAALVERVAQAADDVRMVLAELRTQPVIEAAGSLFRGYGTLERLYRLLGELVGDVRPGGDVYLTQVQALLTAPISAEQLPAALREGLAVEVSHGPAR